MNDESFENIELSLPLNGAYVSAARLTASSIANRLGFDVDEMEDIKAAVSEACTYLIKKVSAGKGSFKITFSIYENRLNVLLDCQTSVGDLDMGEEISLMMINALTDFCEIGNDNGVFSINMSKSHKNMNLGL